MKASVMRAKTRKAKEVGGKQGADIMWRDCQWNASEGVSTFFVHHVPNYTMSVVKREKVKAC